MSNKYYTKGSWKTYSLYVTYVKINSLVRVTYHVVGRRGIPYAETSFEFFFSY